MALKKQFERLLGSLKTEAGFFLAAGWVRWLIAGLRTELRRGARNAVFPGGIAQLVERLVRNEFWVFFPI